MDNPNAQAFIPMTDALLDAAPAGRLVPYQVGMRCLHWEACIMTEAEYAARCATEYAVGEAHVTDAPRGDRPS